MNGWANFKPDAFQLLVRRRCHQQLVNNVSLPRIFEMAAPNPGPLCAVGSAKDLAAQTGAFSHASWAIADNLDFDAVQSVPGHIERHLISSSLIVLIPFVVTPACVPPSQMFQVSRPLHHRLCLVRGSSTYI